MNVDNRRRVSGLGLTEIIIASGLIAALLFALTSGLVSGSKRARKLDAALDLSAVKMTVISKIDCKKTLQAAPLCLTSNAYVPLKDATGAEFLPQAGGHVGIYAVRARCNSAAGGGIEVRAARFSPAGKAAPDAFNFDKASSKPEYFMTDEMSPSLRYDWLHPKSIIMGRTTTADSRLCAGGTAPTPTPSVSKCASDEIMQGFNFTTNTPVCTKLSTLAAPATMNCPSGRVLAGWSAGIPNCVVVQASAPPQTPPPAAAPAPALYWRLLMDCYGDGTNPDCTKCQGVTSNLCGTQWPNGTVCSTSGAHCLPDTGKCKVFKCTN